MALPNIIYTDLSIYNFSDSSNTQITGYEIYNLYNYQQTSQWSGLSLTSSSQYLNVDTGESRERNVLIVDNTNFNTIISSGSGFVSLEYADDNTYTTGLTTLIPDLNVYSDTTIYVEFEGVTKRYFRFNFSGSLNDYALAGNIFIDKKFTIDKPYNTDYKINNYIYNTKELTTVTGNVITSQIYGEKIQHEVSFRLLNETTRTNFQNFIRTVRNNSLPFYFYDMESNLSYVNLTSDYNPVTTVRHNQNEISLVMKGNKTQTTQLSDSIELVPDNEEITDIT